MASTPLIANMGDQVVILRMLAVVISGRKTIPKTTIQLRDVKNVK